MEEGLETRFGFVNVNPRFQPAESGDPARSSVVEIEITIDLFGHHDRDTNLRGKTRVGSREARLDDADDRERLAIDHQPAPDDSHVASKVALPEAVT